MDLFGFPGVGENGLSISTGRISIARLFVAAAWIFGGSFDATALASSDCDAKLVGDGTLGMIA